MWREIYNYFIDFIFPVSCVVCRQGDNYLCPSCFKKIKYQENTKCFLCNFNQSTIGICQSCLNNSALDEIYAATYFTGTVMEKIIHSIKYDFIEELGKILAKIIYQKIADKKYKSAIIVPIPLHQKRFLTRGFNQSGLIAKELSHLLQIDYNEHILQRIKNTKQQAKLLRQDRLNNMSDAFHCENNQLKGKTILLVDDVITSGATFNEADKQLKKAGADKVIALAVSHE